MSKESMMARRTSARKFELTYPETRLTIHGNTAYSRFYGEEGRRYDQKMFGMVVERASEVLGVSPKEAKERLLEEEVEIEAIRFKVGV